LRWSRLITLCCCVFPAALSHAGQHSVEITMLQVSRPSVIDPFDIPGTTITLEVTLQDKQVIGLGSASAITTLRDDTGHDLLAAGSAREPEVLDEIIASMGDMFGGAGTLTRKNTTGNIDHRRAADMIDPERNAIRVPVITLGLPSKGARSLQLQGELEILVAPEGEQDIVRVPVQIEFSLGL
jgi:hypothetical protein